MSTERRHTREDSGIRLDREGRWWHDDVEVTHPKIIDAFNRGLQVTEDGKYRLSFGWDWCFVQVEDAAFRVERLDVRDDKLAVNLSDGSDEPIDAQAVTVDDRGIVMCRVKQGRALARFTRYAQSQLAEFLAEEGGAFGLKVGSTFHATPSLRIGA